MIAVDVYLFRRLYIKAHFVQTAQGIHFRIPAEIDLFAVGRPGDTTGQVAYEFLTLHDLFDRPEYRKQLGQAGRNAIVGERHAQKMAENTHDFYQQMMQGS